MRIAAATPRWYAAWPGCCLRLSASAAHVHVPTDTEILDHEGERQRQQAPADEIALVEIREHADQEQHGRHEEQERAESDVHAARFAAPAGLPARLRLDRHVAGLGGDALEPAAHARVALELEATLVRHVGVAVEADVRERHRLADEPVAAVEVTLHRRQRAVAVAVPLVE